MRINSNRFEPTQKQKIALRAIDKKVSEIWKNKNKVNDFISFIKLQKQSSFRDFVVKRIHRLIKLNTDDVGRKRKNRKVYIDYAKEMSRPSALFGGRGCTSRV